MPRIILSQTSSGQECCGNDHRYAGATIDRHPPEELCRLFVTAHDVSIICACKRCFSDIAQRSLKIMSPAATKPDVAVAFLLAYPFGCKALTVYRRSNKVFSCNLSHPSRISSLCMRNSSTELTPLRDGDRYFHRLEYVR